MEEAGAQSTITLSLIFLPLEHDVSAEDLRLSYFECHDNNRVRLYQCADTPMLPIFEVNQIEYSLFLNIVLQGISGPSGSEYQPTRLWRDLYDAIVKAEKIIYIAGYCRKINCGAVAGVSNFSRIFRMECLP